MVQLRVSLCFDFSLGEKGLGLIWNLFFLPFLWTTRSLGGLKEGGFRFFERSRGFRSRNRTRPPRRR